MTALEGPSNVDDKNIKRQKLQIRYDTWKPKFPDVQGIDVLKLSTWIEEDQKQGGDVKLVLVDARSPEEQQVSMIPSRCTLTVDQFQDRQAKLKADGAAIVVYCTAGLRSGLYAAKLLSEAGFKHSNVWNLEGSILAWTLLDLPVVKLLTSRQGTVEMVETRDVHTCMPDWAQYLSAPYTPVVKMSMMGKLRMILGVAWSMFAATFASWAPARKKSV